MHPAYTIYCEVSGLQNLSKPTVQSCWRQFATSSCDFTKNDMNYPYGETLSIFWPTFWIVAMQGTDAKASCEKGPHIPLTESEPESKKECLFTL